MWLLWKRTTCSAKRRNYYTNPVVERLREIRTGVDKTAAELAIVRLKGEINELSQQRIKASQSISNRLLIILAIGTTYCLIAWIFGSRDIAQLFAAKILASIFGVVFYLSRLAVKEKTKNFDKVLAEKTQELKKYQDIVAGK